MINDGLKLKGKLSGTPSAFASVVSYVFLPKTP